ncbi:hypothetical protein [Brevundimonas vesicularis]|uniref:hypothetical protein n=1 Tax=Brevundimonas vesicularis TaxID=41276 RepID=UPI0012EE1F32|nr:hypothetical protein [Brevundimonas vesicularis]
MSDRISACNCGGAGLGEPVQVLQQIDEKDLLGQLGRDRGLFAEVIDAAAEVEPAMAFEIVDNGFVVQLGRPYPQAVVGVRRDQQEAVVLEEALHQFLRPGGSLAVARLARRQIEAAGDLLQSPFLHELAQMPIHGIGPLLEILTTIDLTRPQSFLHIVERRHWENPSPPT